ncbi:hypothetical protein COD21_30410 [Bacillus cereus]|uniref:hypothetical protein n=1 Tax=Bacillus cereus TaxID=1396 RepID=UPI000BFB583D|nr:hypothetical protein [Bacillus cereus]PGU00832.1 hypothetical protein COD21_30410 [Bacillus cereus]
MDINLKIIGACILGSFILLIRILFGDSIVYAAETDKHFKEQNISQTNNTFDYSISSLLTKEYKDEQYPFTLIIPKIWRKHIDVNRDQFDENAKGTINFIANIEGKEYPICSILIFNNNPETIDYVKFGPLLKLGESDKLIYAYIRSSQRPIEYYENKNFKTIYDSIYNKVPSVMKSFKLYSV